MMKRTLLAMLMLVAGFSSGLAAQPYYPGGMSHFGPAAEAPQPGPAAILKRGLRRLMGFASQEPRPEKAHIAAFLDQEIAPYFDFAYMARWAGGRMWQRMTPQQRRDFEGQLQQLFLGALTQRLTRYGGQQIRVLRSRPGRDNEVTVGVAIQNPQGYPARLNFRFYHSSDGWKVFDVSANGNSALMYYRQYFRQQMRQRAPQRGFYGGRR